MTLLRKLGISDSVFVKDYAVCTEIPQILIPISHSALRRLLSFPRKWRKLLLSDTVDRSYYSFL